MDDEFEPTVDMMVNDFDDERTLDEAESCETAEDQRAEADLLQQEQNMPIEKLLAMYGGYRTGGTSAAQQQPTAVGKQDDDEEDEEQVEQREEHSSDESVKKEEDAKACAVSCAAAAAADDRVDGDENDGDGDDDNDQAPEHMAEEEVTPTAAATAAAEVPNFQSRPAKRRRSTLSVLYPELSRKSGESGGGGGERRTLRSEESSGQWEAGSSSDDDEEGDEGGSVDETSWRKTIMIGSVYQATVPGGLQPYTVSQPAVGGDQLLWQPATADNCTSSGGGGDSDELVDSYLRRVEAARQRLAGETVAALPRGAHARDYEQPLYLLLQCSHDAELAFRRWSTEGATLAGWPAAYMTLWSEDECASFENGLRFYGKDFFTIQQQRVRTRSVGELVQFYYLWKKTERHDVFANRAKLEKRKYALTPGVTDYMERFIDEQQRETSVQRSAGSQEGASLQVLMTSSQDSPTHTPTPTAVSQHQWLDASLARDLTGAQIAARGAMAPLVPP